MLDQLTGMGYHYTTLYTVCVAEIRDLYALCFFLRSETGSVVLLS
jgi:hypothetical protein